MKHMTSNPKFTDDLSGQVRNALSFLLFDMCDPASVFLGNGASSLAVSSFWAWEEFSSSAREDVSEVSGFDWFEELQVSIMDISGFAVAFRAWDSTIKTAWHRRRAGAFW